MRTIYETKIDGIDTNLWVSIGNSDDDILSVFEILHAASFDMPRAFSVREISSDRKGVLVKLKDRGIKGKEYIPNISVLLANHVSSELSYLYMITSTQAEAIREFIASCLEKELYEIQDETGRLFSYPCEVYPRKMWVSVGVPIERLRDKFEIDVDELDESAAADICAVLHKEENLAGYLVRFPSVEQMTVHEMSHEASHVAMNIYQDVGAVVDLDNQEPFAYLVSWAANNIDKAKMEMLGKSGNKE